MAERGKKYREAASLIENDKAYSPEEAVELAKKTAPAKFDETLELHLRMGVDPRNATQQVRGVALLPYGLGKQVRILVFAQGEAEKIAKAAGADYVGSDDIIKQIEGGWVDFDAAIATPDMMGKVGKLGKILGRKGLMPNPKSGTVVSAEDLPRVIDGPFIDFIGTVDEIDMEKGKVKVLLSIFGRETPVKLDFLQVDKL